MPLVKYNARFMRGLYTFPFISWFHRPKNKYEQTTSHSNAIKKAYALLRLITLDVRVYTTTRSHFHNNARVLCVRQQATCYVFQ